MKAVLEVNQALELAIARTMEPREFCRRWYEADEEMEATRGYRARCVELLARVTGVNEETVNSKWGSGVDFPNMPAYYKKTLAYADTVRLVFAALRSQPEILELVMDYMKD